MKKITAILFSLLACSIANAGNWGQSYFEVTITNITRGQSFTPIIAASHSRSADIYSLGEAASPELTAIAEGGDISLLQATLEANPRVAGIANSGGLLNPGETVTIEVPASYYANKLSFAAMLIPTNDAFVAVQNMRIPRKGSTTYFAKAYDAGTEPNDELCVAMPGPVCGGAGGSPEEGGEGYIHPHLGITGIGDLAENQYSWTNPVAKVTVKRMRK